MKRLDVSILLLLHVFGTTVGAVGWLVGIKKDGHSVANRLAKKYNLVNRGNVSRFQFVTFILYIFCVLDYSMIPSNIVHASCRLKNSVGNKIT